MRLDRTPAFSRVKLLHVKLLPTSENSADIKESELLGTTVTTWTGLEPSDDVFAECDMRGVLTSGSELCWIAGDSEVEMMQPPRYAGLPEELVAEAKPIASPAGSKAYSGTAEGWPPLIWKSRTVYSAIKYDDYDTAVEVLLCALSVAPDDGDLRPMLLASLKAKYARVLRNADSYPQPWRTQKSPSSAMLDVLRL
ncbi:hypothetical protein [[Mycobacterium] crassicus]|uniref:Tetratricopeptide repeat protein n=1 Tax=[Mycobacterium] crassicus TaxID=2872309 RepID=A0ABU5XMR3_9MYCO|nr:hypothetical protein [Mycolicibacter sp. MYC098]MEB3023565.1 hypothetical protein [Mycolicibacter sp. MYC098]